MYVCMYVCPVYILFYFILFIILLFYLSILFSFNVFIFAKTIGPCMPPLDMLS